MRRVVAASVLLAVLMSLVFAVPVYADRPVVTTAPYQTAPWELDPGTLCPFGITVLINGDIRMTDWYNDAGLPVKGFHEYGGVKAYLTNWDNGNTIRMNIISSIHYTVTYNADGSADWDYAMTGPDGLHLPRQGVVWGSFGRRHWVEHCDVAGNCVVTEDTYSGKYAGFDDPSAMCNALANPK